MPSAELQPKIVKKRGLKRLTLSKTAKGFVVTAPKYAPNYVIQKFIDSHRSWIDSFKHPPISEWGHRQVVYRKAKSNLVVIQDDSIAVHHTCDCPECPKVQDRLTGEIKKMAKDKVRQSGKKYLDIYTSKLEIGYNRLTVKDMNSRWGSCSSKRNINLSLYLAKLPDELIEYVCAHEAAHLIEPSHSKAFWGLLNSLNPDFKESRKRIKSYQCSI